MGFSQHAGVVIVCDGTAAAARRIERVLWNDPATGVMRHADAGYAERDAVCPRALAPVTDADPEPLTMIRGRSRGFGLRAGAPSLPALRAALSARTAMPLTRADQGRGRRSRAVTSAWLRVVRRAYGVNTGFGSSRA